MCASKYGHVAVVELLLKYNALIDLKDVVSLYHEFDAVRTVSHVNALFPFILLVLQLFYFINMKRHCWVVFSTDTPR